MGEIIKEAQERLERKRKELAAKAAEADGRERPESRERLFKNPPLVKADRTIESIVGGNEALLIRVLGTPKKAKTSEETKIIGEIYSEARRIGYFLPEVHDGKLSWGILTRRPDRAAETPCLLCERECPMQKWPGGPWKEDAEGREVKKCWE